MLICGRVDVVGGTDPSSAARAGKAGQSRGEAAMIAPVFIKTSFYSRISFYSVTGAGKGANVLLRQ